MTTIKAEQPGTSNVAIEQDATPTAITGNWRMPTFGQIARDCIAGASAGFFIATTIPYLFSENVLLIATFGGALLNVVLTIISEEAE